MIDMPKFACTYGQLPTYATKGSACFDFYSPLIVPMNPGKLVKIPLGIHLLEPQPDNVNVAREELNLILQIKDRSSMAAKGLVVRGGIIDADYRGEIVLMLHNTSSETYCINPGDRVAQGYWSQTIRADIPVRNTVRGGGGFGSTGA